MSKKAKLITIISSAVVAVAMIVLAICLIVANNNREKTDSTIISCEAGSKIHLVLNENNKVTRVMALDDNAQGIKLSSQFTGMKYDEALELFVKNNVEAGYLDADTTGYTINISLGGTNKNYSKIQKELVKDINAYLENEGIIAGTKVEVKESIASIVQELKESANDVDGKTNKELIEKYINICEVLLKDIRPSRFKEIIAEYDKENNEYNEAVENANATIKSKEEEIATLDTEIANLQNEINGMSDGAEKTAKQSELDSKIQKRETDYTNIEGAERGKSTAYNDFKRQFNEIITKYKDNNSNQLVEKFNADVKANETKLAEHKNNFESNKQATLDKISAYRNEINK